MAGLLGLGGLGGMSLGAPPGLLKNPMMSQLFDPTAMRNYQIKQGLMGAGLGLMSPDPQAPSAWSSGIRNAFAGGIGGAQQAGDDFRNNGMFNMQLMEYQREQDQRDKQTAAMEELIPTLPPDIQSFARAYPQQFGEAYLKAQMNSADPYTLGEDQVRYGPDNKPVAYGPQGTPKPPSMETLYDEKTGQSYKAQWNPQTQSWEKVGGNKADENGITITNPDGTVTQIGGGGTKTTEGDRRANLLIQQIVAQEPQLMASFDTLATTQNAVGARGGQAGRAVMTGEAQVAQDAITNVVANWLYLTSGANATDQEVARQTAMVTPSVFDAPAAIAAKKARLQSIIDTMKIRGNVQPSSGQQKPNDGGGWQTLPNGVRIRQVQ